MCPHLSCRAASLALRCASIRVHSHNPRDLNRAGSRCAWVRCGGRSNGNLSTDDGPIIHHSSHNIPPTTTTHATHTQQRTAMGDDWGFDFDFLPAGLGYTDLAAPEPAAADQVCTCVVHVGACVVEPRKKGKTGDRNAPACACAPVPASTTHCVSHPTPLPKTNYPKGRRAGPVVRGGTPGAVCRLAPRLPRQPVRPPCLPLLLRIVLCIAAPRAWSRLHLPDFLRATHPSITARAPWAAGD